MNASESGTELYNKEVIHQLLIETDINLNNKTELVLIGGTALVVKYLSPRSTLDVDTYSKISKELKAAWKKAEKKVGVKMPLSRSPISEGPYNMEDRFILCHDLNLKHLKVFAPDAVDLVLMKIPRFFGKDRDDISYLIKKSKIKEAVLLKRFNEEMGHVVCNVKVLKSHYLLVIEDNYGKSVADKHQKMIR